MPDPTPPATLASSTLTGISAVSPADIWAVGSYALSGTVLTGLTLTMHHDGTAWTVVPSPRRSTCRRPLIDDVPASKGPGLAHSGGRAKVPISGRRAGG